MFAAFKTWCITDQKVGYKSLQLKYTPHCQQPRPFAEDFIKERYLFNLLHIFYYILWLIPQCQSRYCTAHNHTGAAASYDLISFHRRLGSKQVVFRDISNNLQYRICTVSSVCTEMKRKLFLTPRWVRDSFLNTFSTYLHLSCIRKNPNKKQVDTKLLQDFQIIEKFFSKSFPVKKRQS